jgi:hypothetical protein
LDLGLKFISPPENGHDAMRWQDIGRAADDLGIYEIILHFSYYYNIYCTAQVKPTGRQ